MCSAEKITVDRDAVPLALGSWDISLLLKFILVFWGFLFVVLQSSISHTPYWAIQFYNVNGHFVVCIVYLIMPMFWVFSSLKLSLRLYWDNFLRERMVGQYLWNALNWILKLVFLTLWERTPASGQICPCWKSWFPFLTIINKGH